MPGAGCGEFGASVNSLVPNHRGPVALDACRACAPIAGSLSANLLSRDKPNPPLTVRPRCITVVLH